MFYAFKPSAIAERHRSLAGIPSSFARAFKAFSNVSVALNEIGAVVEKFAGQEITDLVLLEHFLEQYQTSLQNMLRM